MNGGRPRADRSAAVCSVTLAGRPGCPAVRQRGAVPAAHRNLCYLLCQASAGRRVVRWRREGGDLRHRRHVTPAPGRAGRAGQRDFAHRFATLGFRPESGPRIPMSIPAEAVSRASSWDVAVSGARSGQCARGVRATHFPLQHHNGLLLLETSISPDRLTRPSSTSPRGHLGHHLTGRAASTGAAAPLPRQPGPAARPAPPLGAGRPACCPEPIADSWGQCPGVERDLGAASAPHQRQGARLCPHTHAPLRSPPRFVRHHHELADTSGRSGRGAERAVSSRSYRTRHPIRSSRRQPSPVAATEGPPYPTGPSP